MASKRNSTPAAEHQMRHLNNHVLAAVMIEHTNENPRKADVVQICIIPVNNFVVKSKRIPPFYFDIIPFRPETIDYKTASVNKVKIANASAYGIESTTAADRLEEWLDRINAPIGKKIVPICFNWPVVREYLHTWLGFYNFKNLFSEEARDVMMSAVFINDCRNFRCQMIPYPKPWTFPYVCNQHGIEIKDTDDIMIKTLRLIDIYRSMIGASKVARLALDDYQPEHIPCTSEESSNNTHTSSNGEQPSPGDSNQR